MREVRAFAVTALFASLLLLACASGSRTVAVELQDEQGRPTRIPSASTPVTVVIVCTPTNLAPCRALSQRARALAEDGVTLVVIGIASDDPNVFATHPFEPAQTAELGENGALFAVDSGGELRKWLGVASGGGAVVAADGEVLYRADHDASADRLVADARKRARVSRLWAAMPSVRTVTLVLVGLAIAAALLAILILRPRPFARLPLTPGVPFTVSGRSRRRRTSLWLKDRLSLTSGEAFDDEHWPEGLGVTLVLNVAVDGREAFAGQVRVTESGPAGLKMFVLHSGKEHRATKLLMRVDSGRGAQVVVTGMAHLDPQTVATHLELLLA